ncbi:MAG: DUF3108 domain-containing protein [Candidatus Eisenbacteria bacterium]|nr:DUF3108 domain-containing protein [Candidatus Eisenbacteria bacterium]
MTRYVAVLGVLFLALLAPPALWESAAQQEDPLEGITPDLESEELRIRSYEDRLLRQIQEETPFRNSALVPGEKLVFSVRFGPLRAGEATLEIREIVQHSKGPAYRLVSKAQSNSFVSSFYRVDDHVESLMDVNFLFSRYFEKHLREGQYRADRTVIMDQENHLAVYVEDSLTVEMPPRAHDILTAFYYVRTMALEVGDTLRLDSHVDHKNYPIEVFVHKRETVEVPAGTFRCFMIEPRVVEGALFKQKGKLWIWLTDDPRRIPVLMKSEIPVGSIDAVLVDVEGRPLEG